MKMRNKIFKTLELWSTTICNLKVGLIVKKDKVWSHSWYKAYDTAQAKRQQKMSNV